MSLTELYRQIAGRSSSPSISHHIGKYGELPIWVAVECMSFGAMSKLYGNLKDVDKKAVATAFDTDISRLPGWLEAFNELRNICAHSSRLYGYSLKKRVKLYRSSPICEDNKVWNPILALKAVHQNSIHWQLFYEQLMGIINLYKDSIDLTEIGFPQNCFEILKI